MQELAELINKSNNVDTAKLVKNATKLMHRHIDIAKDWNNLIDKKNKPETA